MPPVQTSLGYMGVPTGSTGPYEAMMASINSGWSDFGVPGTALVAGTLTPAQVFGKAKKPEKVSDQGTSWSHQWVRLDTRNP